MGPIKTVYLPIYAKKTSNFQLARAKVKDVEQNKVKSDVSKRVIKSSTCVSTFCLRGFQMPALKVFAAPESKLPDLGVVKSLTAGSFNAPLR